MTVTVKFRLPIGRLSRSTNRRSEFFSNSHESRAKKAQCERAFLYMGENKYVSKVDALHYLLLFPLLFPPCIYPADLP